MISALLRFFIPLLLLFSFAGWAMPQLEEDPASVVAMAEFVRMAQVIAQKCPKSDCMVVALGRSPAPIHALLQTFDPDYAVQLPLSGLRHSENRVLSPEESSKLDQHFQAFLPHIGEKPRVLLVDFTLTGNSLLNAENYLQSFLDRKLGSEGKTRVELVAIADPELGMLDPRIRPSSVIVPEPRIYAQFHSSTYKEFAQFTEQYQLGDTTAAQEENPRFKAIKETLKAHLTPLIDPTTFHVDRGIDAEWIRSKLQFSGATEQRQALVALALNPKSNLNLLRFALDQSSPHPELHLQAIALVRSLKQISDQERIDLFDSLLATKDQKALHYVVQEFLSWYNSLRSTEKERVRALMPEGGRKMRKYVQSQKGPDQAVSGQYFLHDTQDPRVRLVEQIRAVAMGISAFRGADSTQKRKIDHVLGSIARSLQTAGAVKNPTQTEIIETFKNGISKSGVCQKVSLELARSALQEGRIEDVKQILAHYDENSPSTLLGIKRMKKRIAKMQAVYDFDLPGHMLERHDHCEPESGEQIDNQ